MQAKQDDQSRRSNKQRSKETQKQLITAARSLFCEHGYANTGTPQIVAKAKVTRGALYHHFDGKTGLFHAVAMQMADEVTLAIKHESSGSRSPLDSLLQGAKAYFSAMAKQDRARILLVEAAAVLDGKQLRGLSDASGSKELKEGLAYLLPAQTNAALLDALTALVSAAFDRAALQIAKGESADNYEKAAEQLLRGLAQAA